MIHFFQAEIDHFIFEDMPLHDETSRAIGMPNAKGSLTYVARQPGVVAGLRPCIQMARTLGLTAEPLLEDGAAIEPGQAVLRLHGPAHSLHVAWKQGMNLIEYLSGIAGTTAAMLKNARAVNPGIQVAATRKAFPGARRLQQYAVLCGGGVVHRAGLSESILLFAQHRAFLADQPLEAIVQRAKAASPEKFVLVESETASDALAAARAGADGVQLDKMGPQALAELVPQLRALRAHLTVNAAGGIRPDNAAAYAATGVNILVTSNLYTAPAADFAAQMSAAA